MECFAQQKFSKKIILITLKKIVKKAKEQNPSYTGAQFGIGADTVISSLERLIKEWEEQ
tara:strand:+ start:49 stop:225 length:177 start_codon:yes stop_codon:yes gene_type:complete